MARKLLYVDEKRLVKSGGGGGAGDLSRLAPSCLAHGTETVHLDPGTDLLASTTNHRMICVPHSSLASCVLRPCDLGTLIDWAKPTI